MRPLILYAGLVSLTFSLSACTPGQNAASANGKQNGTAGFVNQAVDSLPTPNGLHQGATAPVNRASAMGLNNSGMANRMGSAAGGTTSGYPASGMGANTGLGALGGNSTVQVNQTTKTVTMVFAPRTSTSSIGANGNGTTQRGNENQRLTSISIPVGWTLVTKMRLNSGIHTHGGAAALSVIPYNSNNQGQGGASIVNALNNQTGPTFRAESPGIYAVMMHQTGLSPYILTLVSVTPTIDLPVVSFPSA